MNPSIKDNFLYVENNILSTCKKINRARDEIKIVVVTKKQPVASIIEVIEAGAQHLGENYPEETIQKIDKDDRLSGLDWHMIGHIQSRKIKLLFPNFKTIHSIDNFEIAQKINDYLNRIGQSTKALIEVNIVGEVTKFGFDASSKKQREILISILEPLNKLKSIHFIGLMTMPPIEYKEGQNKECYNVCRELMETLQRKLFDKSFCELSMGTSSDYLTAIGEGATFVRIGEAIMGKRDYTEKVNEK